MSALCQHFMRPSVRPVIRTRPLVTNYNAGCMMYRCSWLRRHFRFHWWWRIYGIYRIYRWVGTEGCGRTARRGRSGRPAWRIWTDWIHGSVVLSQL